MEEYPSLHPLHNEVVVNKLITLFPTEDLSTLRLVCIKWYNRTLYKFRSTTPITFGKPVPLIRDRAPPIKNNNDIEARVRHILEFAVNPVNKYNEYPYRHFILNGWEFQLESNGAFQDALTERFCRGVVRSHITTLALNSCKFRGVEEFRQIIYTCCPNLQSLSLFRNEYPPSTASAVAPLTYEEPLHGEKINLKSLSMDLGENFPVTWLELFSHFPLLQSLKVLMMTTREINKFINILQAISIIRANDGTKLPLKSVDIDPYVWVTSRNRILGYFRELNIHLKRVHFCIGVNLGRDLLLEVIEDYANSLTSVEVTAYRRPGWNFVFGVNLEKLKLLSIPEGPSEDMAFLKCTKNLTKLRIIDCAITGLSRYANTRITTGLVGSTRGNYELVSLKELRIEYSVNEDDLIKLVRWFPNIHSLEMPLNDAEFRIVCGGWKNLKSVNVLRKDLTDEGVVGVSNDNLPSILSLQNLTTFKAASDRLTDESVFRGFLLLPELKMLELHLITRRGKLACEQEGKEVKICRGPPI